MNNFEVQRDPGYGLAEEAVRVLKKCKEKWKPATFEGRAVNYKYSLPIRINLK
jgi:protein TonB